MRARHGGRHRIVASRAPLQRSCCSVVRSWSSCVAGVASTPARAAEIDLGRGPGGADAPLGSLAGPEVAGSSVAYAYGTSMAGSTVVSRALDGSPQVAATLPAGIAPQLSLVASTGVLAVERVDVDCREEFSCHYEPVVVSRTFASGPLAGPLISGPACAADGCATAPASASCGSSSLFDDLDAAGDALLVRSACSQRASVYSPAGRRDLGLAVAGALADGIVAIQRSAATPPGDIEVSRLDGRPLYTTAGPAFGGRIAVTEDGSLVQVQGRGLRVSSVSDPAGHVVTELPASVSVRLVGAGHGRVVLALTPQPGPRVTRFVIDALDGTRVAELPAVEEIGTASFDGETLAYATRACSSARITTYRVGDPVIAPARIACPAPELTGDVAHITPTGRLRLALTCPTTATAGCKAAVTATAQRKGRRAPHANAAERFYRLARVQIALDPSERGTVTVKIPSGALRWVRRHRAGLQVVVSGTHRARTLPAQVLNARRR